MHILVPKEKKSIESSLSTSPISIDGYLRKFNIYRIYKISPKGKHKDSNGQTKAHHTEWHKEISSSVFHPLWLSHLGFYSVINQLVRCSCHPKEYLLGRKSWETGGYYIKWHLENVWVKHLQPSPLKKNKNPNIKKN